MLVQRTLTNPIKATGVGLHSGRQIKLNLFPADEDTGIIFRRIDLDPQVEIKAIVNNVGATTLATTLVQGDTQIATIEHLMSAFAGLGIDNVIVEVDDMEVPIMDGSASPFVFLIQSAGIKQQTKPKKFIKIKEEIKVETPDGAYAKLAPYNGFKVTYALVYDDEKQKKYNSTSTVDFNSTTFLKEISRARTFGFISDIDYMKKNKLALGGSEKNAVVIGEDEILNEEGLRSSQELVKHKILDVIGDLYLLQYNIVAEFEGFKSGHSLNNLLLNRLLELPDAWEVISSDGDAPEIRYIEPIIDPSSG
ncbi:MAG: UDP-3-O-[3-hydroxymyristoyl] N-acetylglucosamine deacetylase [Gammaproteobacteria bacterium TMED222]|jgi:UDP-3-O-[3-hydroxymyristoyl] N-acetylglucosamine deacetylase|nr:MAG: UDP-3-O-[3-hydroxymyristoyl] N-acetylglucosamine deacetylase [Gammaproteobacteria bacterium TMED222]RZP00399.1 MAG: UDP-3-O-acyl-N-acetylglucosamine deacetylase [Gammaproteobacteria bacterium]|tara:strand:- start:5572 stop:6492 length:921 start_codon:yes stop_codon:yes gene_type:complete